MLILNTRDVPLQELISRCPVIGTMSLNSLLKFVDLMENTREMGSNASKSTRTDPEPSAKPPAWKQKDIEVDRVMEGSHIQDEEGASRASSGWGWISDEVRKVICQEGNSSKQCAHLSPQACEDIAATLKEFAPSILVAKHTMETASRQQNHNHRARKAPQMNKDVCLNSCIIQWLDPWELALLHTGSLSL